MTVPADKPSLFSLTYVSSAIELFSTSALVELLQTCRRHNAHDGVTGMLLYHEGSFMQVLEGEEGIVRQVYAKIIRDPRHDGLITLLEGEIGQREFGEWSMGFYNLADPSLRTAPGYSDFLDTPLTSNHFTGNPSRATELLATFKQKM